MSLFTHDVKLAQLCYAIITFSLCPGMLKKKKMQGISAIKARIMMKLSHITQKLLVSNLYLICKTLGNGMTVVCLSLVEHLINAVKHVQIANLM